MLPKIDPGSGWLTLTVLAPSRSRAERLKRKQTPAKLGKSLAARWQPAILRFFFVRNRLPNVNGGQQHEDVGLNQRHAQVQP